MTPSPVLLHATRRDGGVAVLTPEAALFTTRREKELLGVTERLLSEGVLAIVLDLGAVTSIDSAGLGNVVAAFNAVRGAGGRFAIAAVSDRLRDVLAVTMLLPVIPLYGSVDEAATALTT